MITALVLSIIFAFLSWFISGRIVEIFDQIFDQEN
jgi:hypothetical protein